MQGDLGELMKEGRKEGKNERRCLGLMSTFRSPGSEHKSKVVTKDGREFDLKYRFEDAHGDHGRHGG
jgi:hypothetical protein